MSKLAAITLILLTAATAAAHPPPPPEEPPAPHRPAIEWSSWLRVAYGVAHHGDAPGVARVVTPPPDARERGFEAGLGLDLTAAVSRDGDHRLGVWAEARTSSLPVVGAELLIGKVPRKLDMFFYDGEGVLIVRGGANAQVVTGSVAYGYRAPWKLWGPWTGATRYMIGVRAVATATRSIEDPEDWAVTVGLEAEPIGAVRYLLGVRSWY